MKHPHFDALSDQQQKFLKEYFENGFNATKAAIAAGYKEHSAHASGCRVLNSDKVILARKEMMDVAGITPERIKSAVAQIAFADPADFDSVINGSSLSKARENGLATHVVKKIKARIESEGSGDDKEYYKVQEVEFYDRLSALEKLAKIYAMMTDRQVVEADVKLYDRDAPIEDV